MTSARTGKYAVDASKVLEGLKRFQRATVDYAFERLYGPHDPVRHFLVADEVGLGKTLVAKGVIARAIEHLRDKVERIDVVYVCSNSDIARQNIDRLRIGPDKEKAFTLASRMTMLPVQVHDLQSRDLNFVALTPGTSFDVGQSLGRCEERVLLHSLVTEAWGLRGAAPMNALRGHVEVDRFRSRVRNFERDLVDADVRRRFAESLRQEEIEVRPPGERPLRERFEGLCDVFQRANTNPSTEESRERASVVGRLRARLAAASIEALEPDLIILDEFQRFKHLLDGEDDSSQLARELFRFRDARLLLLSATPYRMFTSGGDEGSHYDDFVSTIKFLEGESAPAEPLDAMLESYRNAVYRVGSPEGLDNLDVAAKHLGARLSRVMTRTERLGASGDRNGMLRTQEPRELDLAPADLRSYVGLQRIGRVLDQPDVVEFWKSAPYLLNFMDDYALKRGFDDALEDSATKLELTRILADSSELLLPWAEIDRYGAVAPGNARLRALRELTTGIEAWRLLWVPPSLPCYEPEGAYAKPELRAFTKRLVFSAWRVVPRVIASLLSYEAEGAMLRQDSDAELDSTPAARERHHALLRFNVDDGRPAQMTAMTLLYPSTQLAELGDPIALARSMSAGVRGTLTLATVLAQVRSRIEAALQPPFSRTRAGAAVDERWYWAAPVMLDLRLDENETRQWLDDPQLAALWMGGWDRGDRVDEEHTGWAAHVAALAGLPAGVEDFGAPPEDLVEVLALVAVASPAVATLRALQRVVGWPRGRGADAALQRDWIRTAAGGVGWSFRSLWNLREVTALLRGGRAHPREPYWKVVLKHCADGVIDAVVTEYAHVLSDSLGVARLDVDEAACKIAKEMIDAITLRTGNVAVDDIRSGRRGITKTDGRHLRARFAMRFGDEPRDKEEGATRTRSTQVRAAFNSPFAPFVLASTSVGQEGLDFHHYCHSVVHWNLPSNPVDLEQREGRVHRFKGHAVRRNVARKHGDVAFVAGIQDPWRAAFAAARATSEETDSEIVPYWVYPVEGGEVVQRIVLALPMSRDERHAERLRRSLAVYRMVFGQPRQDDLVEYLLRCVPREDLDRVLARVKVEVGVCSDAPRAPVRNPERPGSDSGASRATTLEHPGSGST